MSDARGPREEAPPPASPPSLPAPHPPQRHQTSRSHAGLTLFHASAPSLPLGEASSYTPGPLGSHARPAQRRASVCPSPTVASSRAPTGPRMDETLPGPEPPRRRSHLYAPHAARSPRCDRPAASIPARHPSSCLCGSGRPDSSTFIVPLTHRQLGQALLMGLSRQCPESLGLSARFLEESSAVPLQPAPHAWLLRPLVPSLDTPSGRLGRAGLSWVPMTRKLRAPSSDSPGTTRSHCPHSPESRGTSSAHWHPPDARAFAWLPSCVQTDKELPKD